MSFGFPENVILEMEWKFLKEEYSAREIEVLWDIEQWVVLQMQSFQEVKVIGSDTIGKKIFEGSDSLIFLTALK